MGWFWGTTKTETSPPPNQDPLHNLDPTLLDFLDKESPQTYNPPPPSPPQPKTPLEPPPRAAVAASAPPMVYADGRYADIWDSYRPQTELEAEAKTDQEKLSDIMDGYKLRKASIARAALENCSVEQGEVTWCFNKGSWMKRMTMCRAENKAFERCYMMQSRFLKALGYLSTPSRSTAAEEEIQMHADKLFHRMLAQESALAAAKASSSPIPTFPPLLSPSHSSSPSSHSSSPTPSSPPPSHPPPTSQQRDFLTPTARAALNTRLAQMPPEERVVEERAVEMEAQGGVDIAREVTRLREEELRGKRERRERGTATVGDTVSGWFGR